MTRSDSSPASGGARGVFLRHVGIPVSNMDRALRFYRDYLGLEVFRRMPRRDGPYMDDLTGLPSVAFDTALLRIENGGVLELLRFDSHPAVGFGAAIINHVGRPHIALTVTDLKAMYARRTEFGIDFQSPPLHSPDNVLVCFCRDPDGTLVELVEPLETKP